MSLTSKPGKVVQGVELRCDGSELRQKKVIGKISPDLRNLTAGNFGIIVTIESILERNIQVKIFLTLEIILQLPIITGLP